MKLRAKQLFQRMNAFRRRKKEMRAEHKALLDRYKGVQSELEERLKGDKQRAISEVKKIVDLGTKATESEQRVQYSAAESFIGSARLKEKEIDLSVEIVQESVLNKMSRNPIEKVILRAGMWLYKKLIFEPYYYIVLGGKKPGNIEPILRDLGALRREAIEVLDELREMPKDLLDLKKYSYEQELAKDIKKIHGRSIRTLRKDAVVLRISEIARWTLPIPLIIGSIYSISNLMKIPGKESTTIILGIAALIGAIALNLKLRSYAKRKVETMFDLIGNTSERLNKSIEKFVEIGKEMIDMTKNTYSEIALDLARENTKGLKETIHSIRSGLKQDE